MLKKIILGIILLAVCRTAFGQDETIPVSSAEKFNKRGIYNNSDLSFNGQEIISDYDGNLMLQYSTPLNFSDDLSSDFTIIFNANVEHRCFRNNYGDSYAINAPEWILGYKGIALQTFNFETNRFVDWQYGTYSGQQVPLLISGYHFSHPLSGYQLKDVITILRADGSKIILENIDQYSESGLYVEKGLNTYGFAYATIIDADSRTIIYKPGDGLTYEFKEEEINLGGDIGPFRAIYLTKIRGTSGSNSVNFIYDHDTAYNPNQYGRKLFKGIEFNNSFGEQELSLSYYFPSYSSLTLTVFIENNNSNDYYTLHCYQAPDNLFQLSKSSTSSRILYINKILNKKNLADEIIYNQNINRKFLVGESQALISYNFWLPESYTTYGKKKTAYSYYGQLFVPGEQVPEDVILDMRYGDYYIHSNIQYVLRDCFTNFMIKERNIYSYKNSNNQVLSETYKYYKLGNNGSMEADSAKDLITEKIIENKLPQPSESVVVPSLQKIVKSFTKYSTEKLLFAALDASSTVKLEREEVYKGDLDAPLVLLTKYKYDLGTFVPLPDLPSENHWNGTFIPLENEIEKFTGSNSYSVKNFSNINETLFDELKFTGNDGFTSTKKIVKSEKWYDPNLLVSEKSYNNFFTNSSLSEINLQNALNYFHKIKSLERETTSKNGLVKSDAKYEYYPTSNYQIKSKPKFLISNYSTEPDTTTFIYYENSIAELNGLLSTKKSGGGVIEEYIYQAIEGFPREVNGIVVDELGYKQTKTFSHSIASLKPFITTIKFSDGTTLGSFVTANNKKEKPDFEIDLNGYYSSFKYDQLGRLTEAAFPGNFCTDCSQNLETMHPLTIFYNDNLSGEFPINIIEKKWLSGNKFLDTQIEFDSFGRLCRTSVRNDAGTLEEKSLKEFDYLGRVVTETQGGSYTHYNNYNIVGDLLNVTNADGSVRTNTHHYGQGTIGGQTYYVQITAKDETGKTKTSYYDQVGNLIAEQLGSNNPTLFYYDGIYRLTKVKTPEGIETTYQYDLNSNVIYKHSPDFGTYRYAYDRFNRLRFQLHVESQEFVFNNYDPLDRLLYTGVINNYSESSFNSLNADIKNSFEEDQNNLVVVNQYDSFVQSGVFVDQDLPQTFAFENPKGRLTASVYRDKPGQTWNYKLYSYDHLGRIKDQFLVE